MASIPACRLEHLGDPHFRARHGLRFACMSGAMANGIGSVEIVEAMARAGFLGVFGSAGLPLPAIEHALDRLERSLSDSLPFGMNLIHSPGEPDMESAVVDLYLKRKVTLVEASAFLNLTLPVVRYRLAGITRDSSGRVVAPIESSPRSLASKSRPSSWLRRRRSSCASWSLPVISARAGRAGIAIPMAEDVTAEADSGGHTDNQPAIVLLPTMFSLLEQMQAKHSYEIRPGSARPAESPHHGLLPLHWQWAQPTWSRARSISHAWKREPPTRFAVCSPRRSRPTSRWRPRPTCSRWV